MGESSAVLFNSHLPMNSSSCSSLDPGLRPTSSLIAFHPKSATVVKGRWWNMFIKRIVDTIKDIFNVR